MFKNFSPVDSESERVLADPRLRTAFARLDRAFDLNADVSRSVRTFFDRQPFVVGEEVLGDEGWKNLVVRLAEPLPADIGIKLAEAVENARSAMDFAVVRLAQAGGADVKGIAFPIAKTQADYIKERNRKLRGLPETVVQLVDSWRPYRDQEGDSRLPDFNDLVNQGKHIDLVPLGENGQLDALRGLVVIGGMTWEILGPADLTVGLRLAELAPGTRVFGHGPAGELLFGMGGNLLIAGEIVFGANVNGYRGEPIAAGTVRTINMALEAVGALGKQLPPF